MAAAGSPAASPPTVWSETTGPVLSRAARVKAAGAVTTLLAEYLAVSLLYDAQPLRAQFGWLGWAGEAGSLGLVALTSLLIFARRPDRQAVQALAARLQPLPRLGPWLATHAIALALFFFFCGRVLTGAVAGAPHANLWAAGWLATTAAVIVTALGAVVPVRAVPALGRLLARPLLVAGLGGAAAWLAGRASELLWPCISRLTLESAALGLARVSSAPVFSDPANLYLGIGDFVVEVSAVCSGIQGIGLITALGGAYLIKYRRELRFPRALIVLPLGIVGAYLSNVLRVAGLVWIGAHVSPAIALGGFHSKAGWLLTCLLAWALLWWVGRSGYFRRTAVEQEGGGENPTLAYLLPLLIGLAVMLVTGATAASFDWLYPLRPLAMGAVLLAVSWRRLRPVRLSLSPIALGSGVVVFALWLALTRAPSAGDVATLRTGLAELSPGWRAFWLASRAVGAVLVAPVAEELAFRGFLLRRLIAADFDGQDYGPAARRPFALIASALAFGSLHRSFVAGTVAGVLYGLTLLPRRRLADAVVAHMVTNALLVGYGIVGGDWRWAV